MTLGRGVILPSRCGENRGRRHLDIRVGGRTLLWKCLTPRRQEGELPLPSQSAVSDHRLPLDGNEGKKTLQWVTGFKDHRENQQGLTKPNQTRPDGANARSSDELGEATSLRNLQVPK